MIVKIFFNTEGFIGAWSHHAQWNFLVREITQEDIDYAKANGEPVYAEMNAGDIVLFGRTIDSRNGVEVIPKGGTHEHSFGSLKVKFHQDQDQKMIKATKEAHKLNKYSKQTSDLEEALYQ
jgi:hypothetical protein